MKIERTRNILFWTLKLNELKRVHLLENVVEHLIFAFVQKDIKLIRAITRFTKLIIEQTRTSFFETPNELERVHILVIELQHPIFGFEQFNIEIRT